MSCTSTVFAVVLCLAGSAAHARGQSLEEFAERYKGYVDDNSDIGLGLFVRISGNRGFGDDQLVHMPGRKGVESISLAGTSVSDAGVARMVHYERLRRLSLRHNVIKGSCFEQADKWPRLEWLQLGRTLVNDDGVRAISKLPRLEDIDLSHTLVTSKGLEPLAGMPTLVHLSLKGVPVTDRGVELLSRSKSLAYLDLSETEITTKSFAGLAGMPQLTVLSISLEIQNVEDLKPLSRLKKLHRLELPLGHLSNTQLGQLLKMFPNSILRGSGGSGLYMPKSKD